MEIQTNHHYLIHLKLFRTLMFLKPLRCEKDCNEKRELPLQIQNKHSLQKKINKKTRNHVKKSSKNHRH
jgi:hypothetical protein